MNVFYELPGGPPLEVIFIPPTPWAPHPSLFSSEGWESTNLNRPFLRNEDAPVVDPFEGTMSIAGCRVPHVSILRYEKPRNSTRRRPGIGRIQGLKVQTLAWRDCREGSKSIASTERKPSAGHPSAPAGSKQISARPNGYSSAWDALVESNRPRRRGEAAPHRDFP
jgi:hypothetical protein